MYNAMLIKRRVLISLFRDREAVNNVIFCVNFMLFLCGVSNVNVDTFKC